MREIRQSGSEGGAAGVITGRPYPYRPTTLPVRNSDAASARSQTTFPDDD